MSEFLKIILITCRFHKSKPCAARGHGASSGSPWPYRVTHAATRTRLWVGVAVDTRLPERFPAIYTQADSGATASLRVGQGLGLWNWHVISIMEAFCLSVLLRRRPMEKFSAEIIKRVSF